MIKEGIIIILKLNMAALVIMAVLSITQHKPFAAFLTCSFGIFATYRGIKYLNKKIDVVNNVKLEKAKGQWGK